MRYKIDHDYHIHTYLSSCSRDPKQTCEKILQYAIKNGLKSVCVTDHYWDKLVTGASNWYKPQDFEHISSSKPLPKFDGVEFLFGCETDMDRGFTVGVPDARFGDFDFMIISTTHLHMNGFTLSEAEYQSIDDCVRLWVERLSNLFDKSLPFGKIGVAHLACPLINTASREKYLETLDRIPSEKMKNLFSRAAVLGCGIELNQSDMSFKDNEKDTVLRPFRIARDCGCKFYLGSDAHHPDKLDSSVAIFERAVTLLNLTEDEKFHIAKNV